MRCLPDPEKRKVLSSCKGVLWRDVVVSGTLASNQRHSLRVASNGRKPPEASIEAHS